MNPQEEKMFDENEDFIASDGRFLTGTETPKYVKSFINKIISSRNADAVKWLEGNRLKNDEVHEYEWPESWSKIEGFNNALDLAIEYFKNK